MLVYVRDNDVNAAIRVLKKKMQHEGTFREMKRRRSYEKTIGATSARKGRGGPPISQGDAQTARARGLLIEGIGGKLRQAAYRKEGREAAAQNCPGKRAS